AAGIADDDSARLAQLKRLSQSAALFAGRIDVKANVGFGQEAIGVLVKPAFPTQVIPAGIARADKDRHGFSLELAELLGMSVIRKPSRPFADSRRESPKSDQHHRVHHCDPRKKWAPPNRNPQPPLAGGRLRQAVSSQWSVVSGKAINNASLPV